MRYKRVREKSEKPHNKEKYKEKDREKDIDKDRSKNKDKRKEKKKIVKALIADTLFSSDESDSSYDSDYNSSDDSDVAALMAIAKDLWDETVKILATKADHSNTESKHSEVLALHVGSNHSEIENVISDDPSVIYKNYDEVFSCKTDLYQHF